MALEFLGEAMRRQFACLISAVFFVSPATGQELTISSTGQPVDAAGASRIGLAPSIVKQLNKLGTDAAQIEARTSTTHGVGFRILVGDDGQIRLLPSPDVPPGEVVLGSDLLREWKRDPKLDVLGRLKAWQDSLVLRVGLGRYTQQSVPPDMIPTLGDLPQQAQAQAAANGLGSTAAPHCSAAQDSFKKVIEDKLQLGQFRFAAPDEATRRTWISSIRNFDSECLVPVVASAAAANGLPLDRLAVVLDDDGTAICMALHIRAAFFITARHCFFDATGQSKPRTQHPFVVMADKSTGPIKASIEPTQPFGAMTSYGTAKDLVVLAASELPETVKARALVAGDFATSTISEPAILIGYFPLADPEKRLPSDLSTGSAAAWTDGLRMTSGAESNYCRVWDRSAVDRSSGCLEHSCQSIGGFSGAPLFVKRSGQWRVVGLNVAGATTKDKTTVGCGNFSFGPHGLLNYTGAVAAVVTDELVSQEIALVEASEARP